MRDQAQDNSKFSALQLALFATLLLLTFIIYQQGVSGSFHFDDGDSLNGLAAVDNTGTAIDYILGGQAGPTGRPLSLATFLLHKNAWPDDPAPFLYGNILIHITNGILLGWMILSLLRHRPPRHLSPGFIALFATAAWLLSPLLASASLLVVQRMTLLSATFVLAGLGLYLKGRQLCLTRPHSGYALMTLAITAGTLLAVLAKENGALLPVYAIVLEGTLLRQTNSPPGRNFIIWKWLFLYLPGLAIVAYFVFTWPALLARYEHRDFTLLERLLTEARIQWEYLKLLAIPRPHSLTPFYDNYPVLPPTGGWHAWAPLVTWLLTALTALLLNRRFPLFTFAVFWFLLGHSLESSLIPLELYFEHRNYLPVIGPLLALVLCLDFFPRKQRGMIYSLSGAYALVIAFSLTQVTALWGNPRLAGEIWFFNNQGSVRAAEYLAKQYWELGDRQTYNEIISISFEENPRNTGAALLYLLSLCETLDPGSWKAQRNDFGQLLATGTFSNSATGNLDNLLSAVANGQCPALELKDIHYLAEMQEKNRNYHISNIALHNLLLVKFRLNYMERDFPNAIDCIMRAYAKHPNLDTMKLITQVLTQAGRQDLALEFLGKERLRQRKKLAGQQNWRHSVDLMMRDLQG